MDWTAGTNLRQLLVFQLLLLRFPALFLGERLYVGPTPGATTTNLSVLIILYLFAAAALLVRMVTLAPIRVGVDSIGLNFVTVTSVKRVPWSEVKLPPSWHAYSGWGVECRKENGGFSGYFPLTKEQATVIATHPSSPGGVPPRTRQPD